jgi:hypothetical protein
VRKLAPILLIAVLLFNMLGYYGLFVGLRLKNTQDLIHRLDTESYSEAETFTLKVPMAVPYHIDQDVYKRVDGEIEYKGDFYRLVKQKISGDTLYIVCLTDKQSKKIKNTFSDYVKTFADKHHDSKNSGKTFQTFVKDYIATSLSIETSNDGWQSEMNNYYVQYIYKVDYTSFIVQPPEA